MTTKRAENWVIVFAVTAGFQFLLFVGLQIQIINPLIKSLN
jgi:hypothetical protein